MMDNKQAIKILKDAYRGQTFYNAVDYAISILEKLEGIKGWPEKKHCGKGHECDKCPYREQSGFICETLEHNLTIDECKLAHLKNMPTVEYLLMMIKNSECVRPTDDTGHSRDKKKVLAEAIHKLFQEKLEDTR